MVQVGYQVAVVVVTAGGSKLADDETVRTWRQQIRRAAEAESNWTSLTGFDHIEAGGSLPYDVQALSRDLNFSPVPFRVFVNESRA